MAQQADPLIERREREVPWASVVGANVYARRVLRWPKMSQEELAVRAGLSANTIAGIEGGRNPERRQLSIRLDTLVAIASALDCEPADLLTWSETTRVYLQARGSWSPTLVRGGRPPASRTTRGNPLASPPNDRHLHLAPYLLHT